MACFSCASISGEKRISPGPTIYEGKYWLIEHAYPTKLKGWLVIVTKRHVETLHELGKEEFGELAELLEKTAKLLHEELHCEKEYSLCLAEGENFHHIHFHIVPKPADLPKELSGVRVFGLLKVDEKNALPRQEVKEFCESLQKKYKSK